MRPTPASRPDTAFLQHAGLGGLGHSRALPWAGMRCRYPKAWIDYRIRWARVALSSLAGFFGAVALAPLPGCGPSWDGGPVVSLRSAIRWAACGRHRGACLADTISRGILTAEGTHPTGEPREVRENESCPVVMGKKGPLVAFPFAALGLQGRGAAIREVIGVGSSRS